MCAIVPSAPRVLLLVLTAVLALAASIPHALAESWPQRTVKLIIPLPPGTGTDIAGRLLAERLAPPDFVRRIWPRSLGREARTSISWQIMGTRLATAPRSSTGRVPG